ncbi:hypothetical protein ABEG99_19225 [Bacillus velezensis]|uniref:hypothetical protein n=1 Tax=Bacillus velezensis TaxID=492670 RepID=UPI003208E1D2
MTMIIALKWNNSIVMTADKRYTQTNGVGQLIKVKSDNYVKIKIINDKYVVSFAGAVLIAEKAFELINQNIDLLNKGIDPFVVFKDAFKYGKACFEAVYPGVKPISVFYVGFMERKEPKLFGFTSDDDYRGLEIEEISIKMNSNTPEQEVTHKGETLKFISSEIAKRPYYYAYPKNVAKLNSKAIKRIEDIMIGTATYSVVLSFNGTEEYNY